MNAPSQLSSHAQTRVSRMAAPSIAQISAEMHAAFGKVEALFALDDIVGEVGAQFILSHAIKTSCHPFTVLMTFLGGLPPLMNGATTSIFPGHDSPMNLFGLLVGDPHILSDRFSKTTFAKLREA